MIGRRKEENLDNVEFEKIYKENHYKLNLRKETQHFIFHYTELYKTCIDEVSAILQDSYDRITNNFNQQLQDTINSEVLQNYFAKFKQTSKNLPPSITWTLNKN